MIVESKPLTEITGEAIHLLCKELGVVDTLRFLNQFSVGYGDYTEERRQWLDELSVDNIVEMIKQRRAVQR